MATVPLNPAFATQGGKPLPIAFGYVSGSGDPVITYTDVDNNTYSLNILFDGECDGFEQIAITAEGQLWSLNGFLGSGIGVITGGVDLLTQTHFHNGRWTPIGLPVQNLSVGPEQGFDTFFSVIPSVTPAQSFSNICYLVAQNPVNPGSPARGAVDYTPYPVQIYGVFRGARCRVFDSAGNVIGYGFTTNPTWHMVELILRYKIKRQQPQIAGLTAAEKACFNWPAIVAHAARNDEINSVNGLPMWTFNGVFAAQSTLTNMLETILRCCRSYQDDQDGKIAFYGHDAADSLFTLTANHCYPGTFQVAKKDLTRAPNVFVPKYRDLGIAALIQVVSVVTNNSGRSAGSSSWPSGVWGAFFDTNGINPFTAHQVLFYGDGNPQLNGDWLVSLNMDPSLTAPEIWCYGVQNLDTNSTGGYIGTQNSRFQQRAPTNVQHRSHQTLSGYVAPGIPRVPNVVPVEYDLANMTYDQANRLMQHEMNSTLGNDGAGWTAPLTGTVRVRLEAIDPVTGNAFCRMRAGEALGRFTVDSTLSPEFAGEYFIDPAGGGIKVIPPSPDAPMGALEVAFRSYNPDAYPSTSYPPDDSLRTIASATLPLFGATVNMAETQGVAWPIEFYLNGSVNSDGTIDIVLSDIIMQLLGLPGYTTYGTLTWSEIPVNTYVTLYIVDSTAGAGGGTPTTQFIAAGSSTTPGTDWYAVTAGTFGSTFTTSSGAGGGQNT